MRVEQKEKWYYTKEAVIILLLCVGVLALPLLFLSPHFTRRSKIIISVIAAALTAWLTAVAGRAYHDLMMRFEELKRVCGL